MWFATRDGLNKFDGYEFNVYRYDPQDSTTIPANYVRSIHEDGEKNLWVGTIGGGLSKFDRKSGGFVRIGAKQSGFTTNSPLINPMHRDASGRIWIGTYGGGLNSFRPHEMRFEYYMHDEADPTSLSHNDVYCMVESPPGILWIGTQSGLNKYDLSLNNGKFERFTVENLKSDEFSDDFIRFMLCDEEGVLWLGTNHGGLVRFDPATKTFKSYRHDPRNSSSIGADNVNALCLDRTGTLWVGTFGGGLAVLDRITGKFRRFTNDPRKPGQVSRTIGLSRSMKTGPEQFGSELTAAE